MPMYSASFLAIGSYSSAVHVLDSGISTRSLGAASLCFRVEYTQ